MPTLPPPGSRILLVRDGDFYIHVHQLAELLTQHGFDVEVLQTAFGPAEPLYRDLIQKTRQLGVECHLVHSEAPWLERKIGAFALKAGVIAERGVITPHKVRTARAMLASRPSFDIVIAFDPASLYLASLLFPEDLQRIVEYSLEISDETHGDFQASRTERAFRLFEREVLPRIGALLIQDRFRAQVLLRHVPNAAQVKTVFMPVAINGAARELRPAPHDPFTVLFFGGLWSATLLDELEKVASRMRDSQRLRIQGGRGTARPTGAGGPRLEVSTAPVPFDRINDAISAADVGLAVYPQAEANSRCSAFAGEKVARYLQCGLPFIAFDNEDYAFLRDETGCCELVRAYDEIPDAINRIMDDYPRYQAKARTAFERYYERPGSAAALLGFLESRTRTS